MKKETIPACIHMQYSQKQHAKTIFMPASCKEQNVKQVADLPARHFSAVLQSSRQLDGLGIYLQAHRTIER